MTHPADVDALLAKEDIRALSLQYMRGLDRLDAHLLRSVFFDDAQVDYGFYRGSAQEFVPFAMRALRDHRSNHHFIGQMSVDRRRHRVWRNLLPGFSSHRRFGRGERPLHCRPIRGPLRAPQRRLEDRFPRRSERLGSHRAGSGRILPHRAAGAAWRARRGRPVEPSRRTAETVTTRDVNADTMRPPGCGCPARRIRWDIPPRSVRSCSSRE